MTPSRDEDIRPVPDPTTLTTDALHREIEALDRLFAETLKGFSERVNRVEAVELERHQKNDQEHLAIERIRLEQKNDTQKQVEAAFAAAKELVTQQNTSNGLAINKSDQRIDEIKLQAGKFAELVPTFVTTGMLDSRSRQNLTTASAIAGIIAVLFSVIGTFFPRYTPPQLQAPSQVFNAPPSTR